VTLELVQTHTIHFCVPNGLVADRNDIRGDPSTLYPSASAQVLVHLNIPCPLVNIHVVPANLVLSILFSLV
jgi:hypothetical protein